MSSPILWDDFLAAHRIESTESHILNQSIYDTIHQPKCAVSHTCLLHCNVPMTLECNAKGEYCFDSKYERNEDAIENIQLVTDTGIDLKIVIGDIEYSPNDLSFIGVHSRYHDCKFRFIVQTPSIIPRIVQVQYTGYWFGTESRHLLAANPILTKTLRYERGMVGKK